jgi:hypothetical protein
MTLTTALALLAVAVLLGVGLQGWWAMRRARVRQPALARIADEMTVTGVSVAEGGERVEPPMDGGVPIADGPDGDPAAAELHAAAMLRLPARRPPRLDALIDALVPLALDAPVSGELLLLHLPPTRRAGSKPFYIEGLDTETGEWEAPAPGRRYGELQAGVQMANRSGALNEIEYSEFLQKVEAFALAVGATTDATAAPDMREVVARARELDGLTSPLDAQLTLTLRANGVAWSVAYVQQVAARLGFVPGGVPGRWVLPSADEAAPPVLVLSVDSQAALAALDGQHTPAAAVREAVLVLDAAQTAESAEPYPAWHRAATQLGDDLDATPVDDEGQPLTLHAFDGIGRELADLYRRLEALDLAAGTPAARRLFS